MHIKRIEYELSGTVQGVGFRPTVYRTAAGLELGGSVQNRTGTVRLALEGTEERIKRFWTVLRASLPPHADIRECRVIETCDIAEQSGPFYIASSAPDKQTDVAIPADLALCDDCRREIMDPADRRYGYAFTTCTNCGPRYTVVRDMPYDRERTSLADFPLCPACRAEYEHPMNRRFHAESTACPDCGPTLTALDAEGRPLDQTDPVRMARRTVSEGGIVAVRGIGGFLLACQALNSDAVGRLRKRKQRPHKPLAVMARHTDAAKKYAVICEREEALLNSSAAPIVILDIRPDAPHRECLRALSPDTATIGILPVMSPLHLLLFEPLAGDPIPPFDLLVMTSGNRRGEPICLSTEQALDRLRGIADLFLTHDRNIELRNDDSLCILQGDRPQVWRRARGYAPQPLILRRSLNRTVLAMGAELKNAVALGYGDRMVCSPHIGDLETPEAAEAHDIIQRLLPAFLDRSPEAVAVDLHPDMHSTLAGETLARERDIPLIRVQHHHAHAGACMAEHGLEESLTLSFDGTGLGPDGHIWGAELLHVTPDGYRRLASFTPCPLPGGDAAVVEPVRQLVARFVSAGIEIDSDLLCRIGADEEAASVWTQQCRGGFNAPLSHAAGRLFDAFSVLIGTAPTTTTYDGQSAIRLEAAAQAAPADTPALADVWRGHMRDGMLWICWDELFRRFAEEPPARDRTAVRARAFHRSVAYAAVEMIRHGMKSADCRDICLTGGVFMNRILTTEVLERLRAIRAVPHIHERIPPNDGGIAAGQVWVAGSCYTTA